MLSGCTIPRHDMSRSASDRLFAIRATAVAVFLYAMAAAVYPFLGGHEMIFLSDIPAGYVFLLIPALLFGVASASARLLLTNRKAFAATVIGLWGVASHFIGEAGLILAQHWTERTWVYVFAFPSLVATLGFLAAERWHPSNDRPELDDDQPSGRLLWIPVLIGSLILFFSVVSFYLIDYAKWGLDREFALLVGNYALYALMYGLFLATCYKLVRNKVLATISAALLAATLPAFKAIDFSYPALDAWQIEHLISSVLHPLFMGSVSAFTVWQLLYHSESHTKPPEVPIEMADEISLRHARPQDPEQDQAQTIET